MMPIEREAAVKPEIRIGTSGWNYPHWKGPFYPESLPKSRWLEYYTEHFDTVELNATFYRMPGESTVERWRAAVPSGFVFAVKGSRTVTHVMRLKDAAESATSLCERMSGLGDGLGPILWQLPPSLQRDDKRLEAFISALPDNVRHTIEFRHQSWWHPGIYALLEQHRVAVCLVDVPGFRSPALATTDFVYIRFHGATALYGGSYATAELAEWASALRGTAGPARSIFAYFNNDSDAHAVANAMEFRRLLASP